MRLVYVTSRLPYGGREEYLVDEIRCLQMLGHTLLLVPRSVGSGVVREERRHLLPMTRSVRLFGGEVLRAALATLRGSPLMTVRLLADYGQSRNARIFFTNLMVFPKALWLAALARTWKADGFFVHWGTSSSTMVMTAAELSGLPWIMTLHRGDIVKNNLLEVKCARATFVRFISDCSKQLAMQHTAIPEEKATVIHMSVTLPESAVPVPPPPGTLHLLCPAALLPVKGHNHLLNGIALLHRAGVRVVLTLAGDGPMKRALKAQVKELHLEQVVRCTGYIPHDRLMAMYARGEVDAVILASVDMGNGLHEAIPVALMEAMSYGIPVIATRTGGIEELLGDGAGLLIDPGDSLSIAEAVTTLMLRPALRAAVGKKGRERVENEFNGMREAAKLVGMLTVREPLVVEKEG